MSEPESVGLKFVVSAAVTWTYELCGGHMFEFAKILKQTHRERTYMESLREVTRQKGLVGMWDGFFPWGSVQALLKGSSFGGAQVASRNILEYYLGDKVKSSYLEVISGGIGGGFQGIVLSPALLLKTRVMTNPVFRKDMTMWETTKQSSKIGFRVIRREGRRALMKGSGVFAFKRVGDWSTRYMFSNIMEDAIYRRGDNKDAELSVSQKLISSLLGGCLSTMVTIPVDVMVAQIQCAQAAGKKVSVLDTFKREFKGGGLLRLIRFSSAGFGARILHVACTTALMKTCSSWVYEKVAVRRND